MRVYVRGGEITPTSGKFVITLEIIATAKQTKLRRPLGKIEGIARKNAAPRLYGNFLLAGRSVPSIDPACTVLAFLGCSFEEEVFGQNVINY